MKRFLNRDIKNDYSYTDEMLEEWTRLIEENNGTTVDANGTTLVYYTDPTWNQPVLSFVIDRDGDLFQVGLLGDSYNSLPLSESVALYGDDEPIEDEEEEPGENDEEEEDPSDNIDPEDELPPVDETDPEDPRDEEEAPEVQYSWESLANYGDVQVTYTTEEELVAWREILVKLGAIKPAETNDAYSVYKLIEAKVNEGELSLEAAVYVIDTLNGRNIKGMTNTYPATTSLTDIEIFIHEAIMELKQ